MNATVEAALDESARELAKDIDSTLMMEIIGSKWHKITLGIDRPAYDLKNIDTWLKENCQGRYFRAIREIAFELESDMTLFILQWI